MLVQEPIQGGYKSDLSRKTIDQAMGIGSVRADSYISRLNKWGEEAMAAVPDRGWISGY